MEIGNSGSIEDVQEKIKDMSPEELGEFQKKNCIFCQIVDGKVNSKKVYEDDKVLAILDINPANPGHILLLPKEHYQIMPQLDAKILRHISKTVKLLSNVALRALQATGTTVFIANGIAAGQRAQHFMVHIIPRKEDDGLTINIPENKAKEFDLEVIRKKLVETVNKNLGVKANGEEKKKNKVVEAEFVEKSKETNKKKKENGIGKDKKERKKNEEVDLDAIAKVLSGKM